MQARIPRRMPLPELGADSGFVRGLSRYRTPANIRRTTGLPFPDGDVGCDNPTHLLPEIWRLLRSALNG